MNRIATVFAYELRRGLRRRGFLFMTFGVPLVIYLIMFAVNVFQTLNRPDEPDQAADLLQAFQIEGLELKSAALVDTANVFPTPDGPLNEFFTRFATAQEAIAALQAGTVDVVYEIDPAYLETGEVTLYLPALAIDRIDARPVEQLFYTTLARDIDPAVLARLRSPVEIQEFNLMRVEDGTRNADSDFLLLYVFAFTFLTGMFLTNGYLLQSVIEEKENRVIEVLITSIRPTELLAGKVLAFATMGLFQILVWVVAIAVGFALAGALEAFRTLVAVAGLRIPTEQLPIMALYFVAGYLMFAGVYGAVGAISNSMREGPGYAAILTLPAAIPFYFFALFQASPGGSLPTFLSIFPLTSPVSMIMRLSVSTVPPEQIILSLALLFLTAFFMMWLAGRLFRVQSLLAGKVPKLRDLPKLIRE